MPSCTATPTSASSTAPATRRSWSRRRARLGLTALALTDHDGFYGVVRFAEAAREVGLPTIFGAELSLGPARPADTASPTRPGAHLLVLARGREGYARLARTISEAHLRGRGEGPPGYRPGAGRPRTLRDHVLVLTGCRKGHVPAALATGGAAAAAPRELDRLVALFGRDNVAVELTCPGDPLDDERNDALAALAARGRLPTVATNNVHYPAPARRRLATALAAVRARRSLDEMDGWLPAAATAHLRSGAEMAARFARLAGGGGAGRRARPPSSPSTCTLVAPKLPRLPDPRAGHTEMSWLRKLT